MNSPSEGVRGRLDDVRDVPEESEGSGLCSLVQKEQKVGDDGGEGVTEKDRCIAGIWIVGREAHLLLPAAAAG